MSATTITAPVQLQPWLQVTDRLAGLDQQLQSLQTEAITLRRTQPGLAKRLEALVDSLYNERDSILEEIDRLSGVDAYYRRLAGSEVAA